MLVGLELDHQVDFLAHENVGVALRDFRAVAIIERDELDSFGRCGSLEAQGDLFGKRIVGALRGIAQSVQLLLEGPQRASVEVFSDLVDHTASLEGVQQTERHALRQTASARDLAEGERFAGRSKGRQQP
jgi:hypothetical protein